MFDAFLWLLFDKDSQNQKDFAIKTLDENGQVISGLDHEVAGEFELNGNKFTLRKVYSEKWTRKRGGAKAEFTGHTTDYFLNGVPVKKNEYVDFISGIVDEDVFKLITSPTYFNEQLHWQKRRQVLLQVCGDISDSDVIASDKALAKLPVILGDRSIEEHRKVIAARRSEINKELEKIPVRIDEALRSLPDIEGLNEKEIEGQLDTLEIKRIERQGELTRVLSGGQIAEKKRQLAEAESELLKIETAFYAKRNTEAQAKIKLLNGVNQKINNIENTIKQHENTIKHNKNAIEKAEKQISELRAKWHEINSKEFTFEQSDTCPTCGQTLPEEQLQEAREKALEQFNLEKSQKLQEINDTGKEMKANIEDIQKQTAELEAEINRLNSHLAQEQQAAALLQKQVDDLQGAIQQALDSEDHREINLKIYKLKDEIEKLQAGNQEETEQIRTEIAALSSKIINLEQLKAKMELHKITNKRIEDLKALEKQLATEYEKLEEELYLTEQFIRAKVQLLEEKINSRFKMARFKLFDVQVNGGVVECCETLYNGVPYSSGLNNAARINVGLDIINTLSEYYGFNAPIFVDNAEAVTELIQTKGQVIRMVVFEGDKKLRVEVQ